MNRIYVVSRAYKVIILAFVLMDTHVHFILYGTFDQCCSFVHEYIRRTSQYIALKHLDRRKLRNVNISHQAVTDDYYLKTAICYTLSNPVAGGLPYLPYDYPWSSGPLYFRPAGTSFVKEWSSTEEIEIHRAVQKRLKTRQVAGKSALMGDGLIFPGEYVAVGLVERIFRTHRSFFFFLGHSKEEDIESLEGRLSYLTIPMQEMRQHKTEVCRELFGVETIKTLNPAQRLKLAKVLRSRFNCSVKQIIRICGLVYEEVKGDLR